MTNIKRTRQPSAMAAILDKPLLCGGEWIPRGVLYQQLIDAGHPRQYVDFYLFCLGERTREEEAIANKGDIAR